MIIAAEDLRRLVVRVAVVTLALRAVSMFSVDPMAREVARMLPPAEVGAAIEGAHGWTLAWATVMQGLAPTTRLPAVFADVALVLLCVAYARGAGWGTIAGLMAGAVTAMAPLGLGLGWRVDANPAPLLVLLALWQLRVGLRRGELRRCLLATLALLPAVWLTPASLVALPGALWLAARSVTLREVRLGAGVAAIAASVAGLLARLLHPGALLPLPEPQWAWLGGAPVGTGDAFEAVYAAAGALSVAGPTGSLAAAAELTPAPTWRVAVGALLWLVAALGYARGLVREDLPKATPGEAPGLGGFRTLGVAVAAAPRRLGERDALPLLLPGLLALLWVAVGAGEGSLAAAARASAIDAVAVARAPMALLLGAGLAAIGLRPALLQQGDDRGSGRASVVRLVALTLVIFGVGGAALVDGATAVTNTAPRKVARQVAEEMGVRGQALLIGSGGLRLRWKLAAGGPSNRIALLPTVDGDAPPSEGQGDAAGAKTIWARALATALSAKPPTLVIAGDRAAVGGEGSPPPAVAALEAALLSAGYEARQDGHWLYSDLAVRSYERGGRGDPATVRPQLAPGVAP